MFTMRTEGGAEVMEKNRQNYIQGNLEDTKV